MTTTAPGQGPVTQGAAASADAARVGGGAELAHPDVVALRVERIRTPAGSADVGRDRCPDWRVWWCA